MYTGVGKALITDRQGSAESLSRLDETVLAMVVARTLLSKILGTLCEEIEKLHSGLLCSVLLLDEDGVTLRSGAAPSLPAEYCQAIDGVKIGPCAGSCGTAAYRRQPVVVTDVASDPLWAEYRQLALSHGLRACWSTPITAEDGRVLGTFAIYYREPGTPDPQHLQIIAHATHLAGIAIAHDRTKFQLRAAEDRYRTLVERLPAITYIAELGSEGPWHYVSPQIESILGFSSTEWLSDPAIWINRIHEDDRDIALAAERRFEETHELFEAEYRMVARDGRVLWFRDEAVMLNSSDDRPLLMQGVLYDLTEHKRLEDQLRHSQKMEAVGQLAGGMAHDFNNLLMVIQAHNERLLGSIASSDPGYADAIEIERTVVRASSLTRQLLAFSRKQVLQTRLLDLNTVVVDVVRMLGRLIANQVEVKVMLAPDLGRIKADPGQIEQLILNLSVNACDAMPHGGRLLLETTNVEVDENYARKHVGTPTGKHVMLSVSDNGIGMNNDVQAHIFEPFFTTKEPGKGTGLGLSMVYGTVKQMGGAILVHSELARGTTFEIFLPRAEERKEATISESGQARAFASTGTETVLLVEDQDGIREVVGKYLLGKGYTVLHAIDGEDALRVAGEHKSQIHLLVTDVIMPKMGGQELVRRLMPLRPEMKALFMSGHPEHASSGGKKLALDENIAVLQKPFQLDTLGRKIRSVLDAGCTNQ